MAKAKKAGGKAGGGARIPKKIGGVKIPKEARRAGEALIEKAQSPAGRQVIASGLAMAATAAAAMAARQAAGSAAASPPPPPPAPGAMPPQPGAAGIVDPQAIADTIGQVTDAVLGRLFGGRKAG